MDLFGSTPKKMPKPKRKPEAVAPAAQAAAEPALLMPNVNNLLASPAAEAAAAMPNVNNMWHPNTGFRPNVSKEEAARRAAALRTFVARSNAAAAGGAGRGPSAAAAMSNMPLSPKRPRPGLYIPNNGRHGQAAAAAAAGTGVNYVSPATTSSPPPGYLHPFHEHIGENDEFYKVSLTPSRKGSAAAGKSPRRASRRAARKSRKSRKTRRT